MKWIESTDRSARVDVFLVVLGAVRCQSAKTARAWCIAGLAIGECGRGGWQKWQGTLSARSAMPDEAQAGTRIYVVIHLSATLTLPPQMTGGQKLDEFVDNHFSKEGERNTRTNRWKMKCNYCIPDTMVEHCELRCTEHLSKPELCPNAPEPVRKEALTRCRA